MFKSIVYAGICGFETAISAKKNNKFCNISIKSNCPSIVKLANVLKLLDPMQEISYRGEGPQIFKLAKKFSLHPACPVPVGIIKTMEAEMGLALPANASIKFG